MWTPPRRHVVALVVSSTLALSLVACSGSSRQDGLAADGADATETTAAAGGRDESSAEEEEVDGPPPPAEEGAYPVTIEHAFGETTIDEIPQRIVTVGWSDQDAVLAFGHVPVGVTDWYGDKEFATWEWAQDELGDAEPTVLADGEFTGTPIFDFEEIRALEPDLILGLYTEMDDDQYANATSIAPTVVGPEDPGAVESVWREVTRSVGAALGQPQRADELVAEVEAEIAAAAEEHPEFAGQEAVVAEVFEFGSTFARGGADPRTQLIGALGFVSPVALESDLEGVEGIDVSDEELDVLDHDLILWNIGFEPSLREDIEDKPLYDTLQVVEDGRSVFLDDPLTSAALTWGTVLSIPYAVDEVVPLLAAAYA